MVGFQGNIYSSILHNIFTHEWWWKCLKMECDGWSVWGFKLHSKLCSIRPVATKVHVIIQSFCSVNMDAWSYIISAACDTMKFEFILLSPLLVWSTPLGLPTWCGICIHQHFNKWHKKKQKNKKVTLHMLAHDATWGCRLTSLVVCINDNIHDIRERNVTIEWDLNYKNLFPRVWGY